MQVTITNGWFKNYDVKPYLKVGHTYDVNELVYHEHWSVRCAVAEHGYGLDVLVNDKEELVRRAVAEQGYGLDILVNDEDYWVRETVVKQGYGLDILVNDKNWIVRLEVAKQGYGLDVLVNDGDYRVRCAVAEQGYGLDILVNDTHWEVRQAVAKQGYELDVLINDKAYDVRQAVAKQGYGLDILVNDKSFDVRETVLDYLKDNGYKSIEAWAKANPDKVHGNNNFETTDTIKDFIYKIDDSNTLKVESSYESVDAFFNDSSKESYESNEALVILTVDTNVPLIKLEKSIKYDQQVYKFIVNITNEDGDNFNVKSIITSKEKFSQLLESTINALNEFPQFSRYADDLENCL